ERPGEHSPRGSGCGGGRRPRRRGRSGRPSTTRPCARERDQVRRRSDAHDVRDLLVRSGCGRPLAGRRRIASGRARTRVPGVVRIRPPAAHAARGRCVRFFRYLWEFVVGDDPFVAAGVVVALALTAAVGVWWLLPLAVLVLLYASLRRAAA